MKTKLCILSITLLLLMISFSTRAENFRQLSLSQGLSQPSVMAISQDGLGRMWFGTGEGINVYDGERVVAFKGRILNATGDSIWIGNNISSITSDHEGNIYFLSDYDLFSYNIRRGVWTRHTQGKQTEALTMADNKIWYITQDSIFNFSPGSIERKFVRRAPLHSSNLTITSSAIYVGTYNGVVILPFSPSMSPQHLLKGKDIYSIFESSSKEIWISTRMEGGYRLCRGKLEKIPAEVHAGIQDQQFRQVMEDNYHNIWFGTFTGLRKYDISTNTYSSIHVAQYAGGLNHPSIFSLYKDNQGAIWAGSYYGGVNYFVPNQQSFFHYNYQVGETDLSFSYIRDMVKDKRGNLWIGTDGGGIACVNTDWKVISRLTAGQPNSVLYNTIKKLYYDEASDCLYIGTHMGGLSRYDLKTKRMKHYLQESSTGMPGKIVNHILMWKEKLYISSCDGMFELDIATDHLTRLHTPITTFPNHFVIGEDSTVYAMFTHRVISFSLKKTEPFKTLNTNPLEYPGEIIRLLATSRGLYICTLGNGLLYHDIRTGVVKSYNKSNSQICSDYCYNIEETSDGKFIITHDNGVSLFDPAKNSFNTFRHKEIFPDAHIIKGCGIYVSPNGEIYVGDTKGIICLSKSNFYTSPSKNGQLYFSDLLIDNKQVLPLGKDGVLPQLLPFVTELRLKAHQTNVQIGFAYSDCINRQGEQEYEFRLEGLDKDWTSTSVPWAKYTHLSPGRYVLHVRLADDDNQPIISLPIYVVPPWYASWWAYSLYVVFALGVIAFYWRSRRLKYALMQSLEKERYEKQQIELLNNEKMRFFTNVSHEFRTPLTLITSYIDTLLQEKSIPTQVYNRVLKMKKNTQYLLNLVSELLDFSKFTQNRYVLRLTQQDICLLVKEVYLSFSDYARERGISYEFKSEPEHIICWFDKRNLEKVLYNLLSNAFKYTPEGGSIELCISQKETEVLLKLVDNGEGISPEDAERIFECFYQASNTDRTSASSGTGIGLALVKSIIETHQGKVIVESELGKGSTFLVTLPLKREQYVQNEQIHFVNTEKANQQILLTNSDAEVEKEKSKLTAKFDNATVKTDDKPAAVNNTILIVEDHPDLLLMLKQLFSPFYKVILARNGVEGLAKANECKPDVILSDVMMPEMDGTEMCRQIKESIALCHIPVVLLTALSTTDQNINGLNQGADDYLSKPFNPQLLLVRINNLIKNRQLIRQQIKNSFLLEVDTTGIAPLNCKLLKRVVDIIEDNIDNVDFDIPMLCNELGIGRSVLYANFKSLTEMSPKSFILKYRLKHAANLLIHNADSPIAEIGDRCGFNSPAYFCRCFKQQYNVTPQTYQKEGRQFERYVAKDEGNK